MSRTEASPSAVEPQATSAWKHERSAELYRIAAWGGGYFAVSDRGTVVVRPSADPATEIDLLDVVSSLKRRGITPPVLIRLPGVLDHRMRAIKQAFDAAIDEVGYRGAYRCVYPIKVNQQRHVVEEICSFGASLGFGIEVGSKAELIAGLALTRGHHDMPVICNGFKDDGFMETVVLAAKMGRNVVPVVEQLHELGMIVRHAKAHGSFPKIGVRARLAAGGIGRWAGSSGFRGKFGLTPGELLEAVDLLREAGCLHSLTMLHCHIGSQVFDRRTIHYAVSEVAHVYTELVHRGAPMSVLNVGGGLGIDYDGTRSATDSSVNYTLEQYAVDVLDRVAAVCDAAGVEHPDLVSESGRALVAHSGLLLCEVLGRRATPHRPNPRLMAQAALLESPPQPLVDIMEAAERLETHDPVEVYSDARHARDEAASSFNLGHMGITARAAVEELYWTVANRLVTKLGDELPEELVELPDQVADLYFCNFSVFQSLLDAWGIGQVFPIMPIHRLDEEPTERGVLVDITCDSDGRIDRFPGPDQPRASLPLHTVRPSRVDERERTSDKESVPYYLGIFLTGAYQETLGDLHNLFGDTHAVHIAADGQDGWRIEQAVRGDRVRDVLGYVQFDADAVRESLRRGVEDALASGRLTLEEAGSLRRFLDEALDGYTYLE